MSNHESIDARTLIWQTNSSRLFPPEWLHYPWYTKQQLWSKIRPIGRRCLGDSIWHSRYLVSPCFSNSLQPYRPTFNKVSGTGLEVPSLLLSTMFHSIFHPGVHRLQVIPALQAVPWRSSSHLSNSYWTSRCVEIGKITQIRWTRLVTEANRAGLPSAYNATCSHAGSAGCYLGTVPTDFLSTK
jgi:hypothetical protein